MAANLYTYKFTTISQVLRVGHAVRRDQGLPAPCCLGRPLQPLRRHGAAHAHLAGSIVQHRAEYAALACEWPAAAEPPHRPRIDAAPHRKDGGPCAHRGDQGMEGWFADIAPSIPSRNGSRSSILQHQGFHIPTTTQFQSPTASLESMDLHDFVKATSLGAITVDDAEREILRRMACADDALVRSKLTAMHGLIKVQAEEGRGGQTDRDLVSSPMTGLTIR
eukprot:4667558-Pleurochrysis_carterae.AAC.2